MMTRRNESTGVNVTIRSARHGRTGWIEGGEVESLLLPKTHLRPVLDLAEKARVLAAAFAAPLERVQAISAQLAVAAQEYQRRQDELYAEIDRAAARITTRRIP